MKLLNDSKNQFSNVSCGVCLADLITEIKNSDIVLYQQYVRQSRIKGSL